MAIPHRGRQPRVEPTVSLYRIASLGMSLSPLGMDASLPLLTMARKRSRQTSGLRKFFSSWPQIELPHPFWNLLVILQTHALQAHGCINIGEV